MYKDHWSSDKMKVIEIDYGNVEVGKATTKSIEIWNESCKEQTYEAQRDPKTNPLDHVFHLRSYTWTTEPEKKFVCGICYRPFVAFSINFDYFNIVDSSGDRLKIVTRGCCIGPKVLSSTTKLTFYTTESREVKKRIKLTNKSSMKAIFMFDIDKAYRPFKLDVNRGVITPSSSKYIMITFNPSECGKYTCHLPCLILHQEPIIIELYGYCGSTCLKTDITYPWKVKSGFEGYMSDSVSNTGNLPPISLSRNYFDFGQADVDMENIVRRIPQAICLTNHSHSTLSVKWERDFNGIFNITPCTMQVRGQQSVLFEISFNPNVKENLFAREIVAFVSLENGNYEEKEMSAFPFVTSVRAIGHSFPFASNGWIPQYEIPRTVIMPPCVPSVPVYTTFLIKRFGHLPLMFHFVPPPASRFSVKPMMGLIDQDYRIITLEMVPKPENEQIYVERWAIYFNGNTRNESYIDFKGYAEYPSVRFGHNDEIIFDPTYPECQRVEIVKMRNLTRHLIKFQFYEMPPVLNIQHPTGEIHSNEVLSQEWCFYPKDANVDYDFHVQCVLSAVRNGTVVGPTNCITVRVCGRSEIGTLMAVPSELHFGGQIYGETKTLSFHVFNISSAIIYYKIICTHCNWPVGDLEKDVNIRPSVETVFPGAHEKIIVSITPRTPGYYEFSIRYLVRINCSSDIVIAEQEPKDICYVSCMCILPTLKIKNLCSYGNYRNINKNVLWKTMQINKVNDILKNILPGERKSVDMYAIPMIMHSGSVYIKLVIKNVSSAAISWNIRRIYECSCKSVIKKKRIPLQQVDLDCKHDELCSVDPNSGTLKQNKATTITMILHYTLLGRSEIKWDFDVQYDRHIFLNMIITCISGSEGELQFLHGKHLHFGEVFFGYKDAISLTHWIHNATNHNLPYCIDTNPICKLNEAYQCELFSCLNQRGIVGAQTSKPVILKFQPRMFGVFKVVLPVQLADKKTELIIEGESSCDPKATKFIEMVPASGLCKTPEFPVYFNADCIDVESISTHDRIDKMLIVYNGIKNDVLAYTWKSREMPGILSIQIHPPKGLMQPRTLHSFRVEIYTKEHPCKIDINVSCEFVNACERRRYYRSVLKHDILCKELEGQFTITEKGIDTPKPWIKILEKPQIFYKALTVRCCIHSPGNKYLKMSLMQEYKSMPPKTIYIAKREKKNVITEGKELSMSLFILEGILWDTLNSKLFESVIKETLLQETNLYYSQFKMNLAQRRRAERRSYISPPRALIASILQKMLFVIIHEEFSLDIIHFVREEDIRHFNELKVLTRENRISVNNNNFGFGSKDATFRKDRSISAVSFQE